MTGEPYMPLYLGDVLAATLDWTGEERALYLLLLAFQWFSGPLKPDPKRLARVAQYDEATFLRLWQTVQTKFVPNEDGTGLVNLKCEEHRARVQRLSSARAAVGAIGGQRTQARRRAATSTRSSSSSAEAVPCACDADTAAAGASSEANGEANEQANEQANGQGKNGANGKHPIQSKPNQTKQSEQDPFPHDAQTVKGLNVTAWERFVAYRRDIRRPIKPASIQAAQRKLAGFGEDQSAVVEQSIANGWQGLFELRAAAEAAKTSGASTGTLRAATDEAWQRVLAHVRSGGYRVRAIGDARIDEAVRQIGGYSAIGRSEERELPFIARKFAATWAVLS